MHNDTVYIHSYQPLHACYMPTLLVIKRINHSFIYVKCIHTYAAIMHSAIEMVNVVVT